MNVTQLRDALNQLIIDGHGEAPVFAAADDEGNGFHGVTEPDVRPFTDEYTEEYGWEDDFPEEDVVVLW